MEKVKHTLILNYAALNLGGIEVYFSKLIEYCLQNDYRVIWLTTLKGVETSDFKSIIDNPKVEKYYVKTGWHWSLGAKLKFASNEIITMVSCEPLDFFRAESLRKKYRNIKSFYHYLILPHFTGNAYYPERYFKSKMGYNHWHIYMNKIAKKLNEGNCLLAFSLKHLEAYERNYNISIENKSNKILPRIKKQIDITDEVLEKRAREREAEFKIITCARFDFPHKGYILGLLDSYTEMKKKYPQLKLVVVGYGTGLNEIQKKLQLMTANEKLDVVLTGALSEEKLQEEFCGAHLNIGLAGALIDGALCALPSLLVRHYSYSCETYGFINQIEGSFLKIESGERVVPYIEKIMLLSNEEYVEYSKKDYKTACARKKYNPHYLFDQKNIKSETIISSRSLLSARILHFLCYLKKRFFHVSSYEQNGKEY